MRRPPRSVLAIDCYLVDILPFERNVMFFRTFSEVTEYDYILSAVFLLYLNTTIFREKYIQDIFGGLHCPTDPKYLCIYLIDPPCTNGLKIVSTSAGFIQTISRLKVECTRLKVECTNH